MSYYIGTSGYNYPEWRGTFYPEKFPAAKMLAFYAERFNTVEVNYTYYRMPTEKLLAGWAAGTPEHFVFTLKAPKRITHDSKLQRCEDLTQAFCRMAATLAFLAAWVPAGASPMCGNTICQDRRFMARHLPRLEAWFHYRNLDVTTLKILMQRWRPDLEAGFTKAGTHLALDDRAKAAMKRFQDDLTALQSEMDSHPRPVWRLDPRVLEVNINA